MLPHTHTTVTPARAHQRADVRHDTRTHASRRLTPGAFMKAAALAACLAGGGGAHAAWNTYTTGSFGPVVNWPLIPIHVALLPDGRVLGYGTDGSGNQTGQFIYDVWNPAAGTDANSHLTLPNTTGADTFCSGQIVLPSSGAVLLTGGDQTVNGVRNYSNNALNFFDYKSSNLVSAQQPMSFLRWYPTVVTTAKGEVVVLGGRSDPDTPVATPEVYTEGKGWRQLTTAVSDDAYGTRNWSYPRAWQAPNGLLFLPTIWGGTYYLDPTGTGTLQSTPLTLPEGDPYLTSVMYAPGKILAFRKLNRAYMIDLNGSKPTAKWTWGVGQDRYHGSATVMADGKVFVSGGSMVSNVAWGVAYSAKIWNPANASWSGAATAKQMRLYHSISLLLPDGRILTAGGGAPGPQNNLNAEIYTPPYLYKQDFSATLATRPVITAAPTTATWGESIKLSMDSASVSRVTLLKTGSATHTVDFDQRFMELAYTASGSELNVTMPASPNMAPPGFYMVFVFNKAGVPSVAKIMRLG